MLRLLSVLALSVWMATVALAQEKFVPYQVDESTHTNIMKFLEDVPVKYAVPVMNALNNLARQAQFEKKRIEMQDKAKPAPASE